MRSRHVIEQQCQQGRPQIVDRQDAILLSRFFYDEGLLAVPVKEAEGRLPSKPKEKLATMRADLDRRHRLQRASGDDAAVDTGEPE